MKLLSRILVLAALALFVPGALWAQPYPTQTPVYIPTAVEQPVTCSTACDVYFTAQGLNTVSVQFTGSPASFTAALRGDNEAASVSNALATWTTLKLTPINGGSTVTSVTAVGTWTANSSGLTRLNVHLTAVSGSVTINLAGTNGGSVSYSAGSVVLTDVEGGISPTTAPSNSAIVGGVYNTTPPTFTNTQAGALQVTSTGQLTIADTSTEGVITVAAAPPKMQVIGGVYNTTAPSPSNGQSVAIQLGSSGGLITDMGQTAATLAPGTAPAKMQIIGGLYNSTPPTVASGQTAALQIDSDGSLYVNTRDDTVVAADPCQSRSVAKSSTFATINTATTTQLVAISGVKSVYVCGVSLVTPASNTIYLESGTAATCASGATQLTPTYPASTSANLGFGGGTVVSSGSATALCAVSTGTTSSTTVLVSYVQQ